MGEEPGEPSTLESPDPDPAQKRHTSGDSHFHAPRQKGAKRLSPVQDLDRDPNPLFTRHFRLGHVLPAPSSVVRRSDFAARKRSPRENWAAVLHPAHAGNKRKCKRVLPRAQGRPVLSVDKDTNIAISEPSSFLKTVRSERHDPFQQQQIETSEEPDQPSSSAPANP